MSYQLKTTGIAAKTITCVAVDPDSDIVKDFASSLVTSTLTLQSGVTIGSQTWNGTSRKYIQTTGTACVAFGANKPVFQLDSTTNTQRTIVFIGSSSGGSSRVVGDSGASFRVGETNPSSGGATYPFIEINGASAGGNISAPASGTKVIYGSSITRGGEARWYHAVDTDSAMTTGVANAAFAPSGVNVSLSSLGKFDYSGTFVADKIHAYLVIDGALSQAEWDSLRTDWFGTLLEVVGSGTPSLVVSDGTHAHAADNLALTIIGTLSIADSSHSHAADSITLTATTNGTITIPAVRDWGTKALKTGQTGVQVDIRNIATGALVVRKTGQTTHATTGVCVVTDAAIVAGTTYEVVTRFADGSRGMWDYTAS